MVPPAKWRLFTYQVPPVAANFPLRRPSPGATVHIFLMCSMLLNFGVNHTQNSIFWPDKISDRFIFFASVKQPAPIPIASGKWCDAVPFDRATKVTGYEKQSWRNCQGRSACRCPFNPHPIRCCPVQKVFATDFLPQQPYSDASGMQEHEHVLWLKHMLSHLYLK